MKKNAVWVTKNYFNRLVTLLLCTFLCISCYDDEDLQQYVTNIDERLTLLENSLKNIQEEMNSVKVLTQALENKLTISSIIEDVEGNYVVSLSNDQVIKVMNSEMSLPLVTIHEENGIYYWALQSDDMITILKDKNGNNMRVSAESPKIRINPTNYEWEISTDGGMNWESTGVVAGKDANCSIFSEVTQDELYAYFTLSDGSVIKFPKSQEFSFDILSGKEYFAAGETKILKIKTSGVKNYSLSKPDGWKVVLKTEGLYVTAPVVEHVYAESEGKVAVMAVSFNGQSVISEINVEIGVAPVSLTCIDELITVKMNGISDYYMGVIEASAYSADDVMTILDNQMLRMRYLKKADFSGSIQDIDKLTTIQPGKNYVIWVIANDLEMNPDNIISVVYTQAVLNINITNITAFNANIEITMANCDSYFIGVSKKSDYNASYVLKDITGNFGSQFERKDGGKVLLSELAKNLSIKPNESYIIWYVIKKSSLTEKDILVSECTLLSPDFTSLATVEFANIEIGITMLKANCIPSSDAVEFYYDQVSETILARYANDEDFILNYLMLRASSKAQALLSATNLSPATTLYLVAVAKDKDGKLGNLVKKEIKTLPLVFDGTANATIDVTPSFNSSVFTFNPIGNPKTYRYIHITKDEFSQSFGFASDEQKIKNALALKNHYQVKVISADALLNGQFTIEQLVLNTAYEFFVLVEDEESRLQDQLLRCSYQTKGYQIIRSTEEQYKTPTVELLEVNKNNNYYDLRYRITPITGTVKTYVRYVTKPILDQKITWKDKHNYILSIPTNGEMGSGIFEGSDVIEIAKAYTFLPGYISVICITDQGEAYEAYHYEVSVPTE